MKSPQDSWTKGRVLGGEVLDLKGSAGGWMFHYPGGSFGSSPWSELKLLIFLIRLGGRNLGTRMMQASDLCPILTQNFQILFYIMQISTTTGWRVDVLLLMEGEGPKLWESWPEVVNVVGALIISIIFPLVYKSAYRCCQGMWRDMSSWAQWMIWVFCSLKMP